ncbi:unnamed protein product [Prunus brigantina]
MAYHTTNRRSTGETPFSLAYGTKVIIPPHVTVPSIGIEVGSIEQNSKQIRLNLDLLEREPGPGADEVIHLTPWKGKRFHDNGMLATFKDIIHYASSYLAESPSR